MLFIFHCYLFNLIFDLFLHFIYVFYFINFIYVFNFIICSFIFHLISFRSFDWPTVCRLRLLFTRFVHERLLSLIALSLSLALPVNFHSRAAASSLQSSLRRPLCVLINDAAFPWLNTCKRRRWRQRLRLRLRSWPWPKLKAKLPQDKAH